MEGVKDALARLVIASISIFVVTGLLPLTGLAATDPLKNQIVNAGSTIFAEANVLEIGQTAEEVVVNGERQENLFDVTVTVSTSEDISKLPASADASVVMLIDVSASMSGVINGESKISGANRAAQQFIRDFSAGAAPGTKREVALVTFASAALTAEGWTDVINPSNMQKMNNAISTYVTLDTKKQKHYFCMDLESETIHGFNHKHGFNAEKYAEYFQYVWGVKSCQYPGCLDPEGKQTHSGESLHSHLTDHASKSFSPPTGYSQPLTGTNIAAALLLGRNLLEEAQSKGTTNLYVVLMTDGRPEVSIFEENWDYKSKLYIDGEAKLTADDRSTTHQYYDEFFRAIRYQTSKLGSMGASILTVAYDAHNITIPGNHGTAGQLLKSISTTYYTADNADELTDVFILMTEAIGTYAKSWIADISLGSQIDLVSMDQSNHSSDALIEQGGDIIWELKRDNPAIVKGRFVYTFDYRVKLNNSNSAFKAGTAYPVNKSTNLDYLLIADIKGNMGANALKSVGIPIPEVKGFTGNYNFSKVSNINNAPLGDAGFSLSNTLFNGSLNYGATSGSDGVVSFANIPSGQNYILKETKAPYNHELSDTEYLMTISFGTVKITRLTPPPPSGTQDDLIDTEKWVNKSKGSISFSVPSTIYFNSNYIPSRAIYLQRSGENFQINVNNTTGNHNWRVTAQMQSDFKNITDGKGVIPANALRIMYYDKEFVLSDKTSTEVLTINDVYSQPDGASISYWGMDFTTGPMLYVEPNIRLTPGEYKATILWKLELKP